MFLSDTLVGKQRISGRIELPPKIFSKIKFLVNLEVPHPRNFKGNNITQFIILTTQSYLYVLGSKSPCIQWCLEKVHQFGTLQSFIQWCVLLDKLTAWEDSVHGFLKFAAHFGVLYLEQELCSVEGFQRKAFEGKRLECQAEEKC